MADSDGTVDSGDSGDRDDSGIVWTSLRLWEHDEGVEIMEGVYFMAASGCVAADPAEPIKQIKKSLFFEKRPLWEVSGM